jgi:hypothetical protein
MRHTFASLGRVPGEEAFNVAGAMGHSKTEIVDNVYAHALPSGTASVTERVTARAPARPELNRRPTAQELAPGVTEHHRGTPKTNEIIT